MKKNKLLIVTLVTFLYFSFIASLVFAENLIVDFEEVKTKTIDGVIVTQDRAADFFRIRKVQGYFTPSREDVLKAESKVISYIQDTTPQSLDYPFVPDLDKKLRNYKRQYVGVILRGKKKIWLNFFCDAHEDSWKRNPYIIFGGGACFFSVLYDIKSERFSHLVINGLK